MGGWKPKGTVGTLIGSAVAAVVGLAVQGSALIGLYLRLRWRERQEHVHRQYLEAVARSLPAGSTLEETSADGSTLRLTTGPGRRCAGDQGEQRW